MAVLDQMSIATRQKVAGQVRGCNATYRDPPVTPLEQGVAARKKPPDGGG